MGRFDPVKHVRRSLAAWGLATALAVTVAPVIAASTAVPYRIAGVEYAASSTEGKFVGVAVAADDVGAWLAVVDHTVLSGGSATITGGTFSYDGRIRDIAGAFDAGGTLTQTGSLPGCSIETFAVKGTLTLTSAAGTGSFNATLTHFRKLIFGRCVTYAATVRGAIEFAL